VTRRQELLGTLDLQKGCTVYKDGGRGGGGGGFGGWLWRWRCHL